MKTAICTTLLLSALCSTACAVSTASDSDTASTGEAVVMAQGCLGIAADATWDANAGYLQIFNSSGTAYASRQACSLFVVDGENITRSTALGLPTPVTPVPATQASCEAQAIHRRVWGYTPPSVTECDPGMPKCHPHITPGSYTLVSEDTQVVGHWQGSVLYGPPPQCAFWTDEPFLPTGYDHLRFGMEAYEIEADGTHSPRPVQFQGFAYN